MNQLSKKVTESIAYTMESEDGDLTFAEFVSQCVSADRSKVIAKKQALVPEWPAEWIEWNRLSQDLADPPNGWLRRGVARRITTGDAGEFARFIMMHARQEVIYHVVNDDEYTMTWTLLQLLAVRDDAAREQLVKELSFPVATPSPHHHLYNTLVALLRDDEARFLESIDRGLSIKQPLWIQGLRQCLAAIHARDAASFQAGIDQHLASFSKSFHPDPLETVISLAALGVYRLAELKQPDLCESVNTAQDLPWDRELFAWQSTNHASLTTADFPNCPPAVANVFLSLDRPQWLDLPPR